VSSAQSSRAWRDELSLTELGDRKVYTSIMEFPFSIYVWHAPRKLTDKPFWQEELRANSQQMAIYAAGLLYQAGVPHQDTVRERPVVKVVRFGITLHCFPDEHTVGLCEKQIARYNDHPREPKPPFWAE
jgi:hypothetical protein